MKKKALFIFPLLFFPLCAHASSFDTCIMQLVESGPDELTLGMMKARCTAEIAKPAARQQKVAQLSSPLTPVARRLETDRSNILKPFTLMAHNPNYILPFAHNFVGWGSEPYTNTNGEEHLDLEDTEIQLQLSIKTPLAVDIFSSGVNAWGGYTIRSFWQGYNSNNSSPFRETNHEPEIWLQHSSNLHFGPLRNVGNSIGLVHQSNGQGGNLSRSWNYAYVTFGFELGDFVFMVKPWYRFQENAKDDNNASITDYLGHGELTAAWKYGDNAFSIISRNNLESGLSRGSVQLGWSFPLFNYQYIKGYVQYFSGYGESLIDYDHYVDRLGVGFLLTDFL